MKTVLHGFLYGHYDSRGGATFVEAKTREEADPFYVEAFCYVPECGMTKEEWTKQLSDDDFLGTATIESPIEITHGMDIDFGFTEMEPTWKLWNQMRVESDGHYELRIAKEAPDETYEESELGEDAFGVVVLLAGKSTFEE